jgi:hypothetical protein
MDDLKWHQIETAPKDGRTVTLGWFPNGQLEHFVRSHWDGGQWVGGWTPTHWRPAPFRVTRATLKSRESA